MRALLAIDPGTKCGWAVRSPQGIDNSGTWDLTPKRFEGAGMRYLRLRTWLREALELVQPELVAFEEVRRHMGVAAAHVYGAIVGVIQEECELRKIPYYGLPVATVKRTACGRGNADKLMMRAAAARQWGGEWPAARENEADSRWIAETAWREFGGINGLATGPGLGSVRGVGGRGHQASNG